MGNCIPSADLGSPNAPVILEEMPEAENQNANTGNI